MTGHVTGQARGHVRRHLSGVTHAVHMALHADPVLSRLADPDITGREYQAALLAFFAFYQQVEQGRARADTFARFALSRECAALAADTGAVADCSAALPLHTPHEVLGALYVAHGASFGRNTFARTIRAAFPDRAHAFVSLPSQPALWSDLVGTLDAECSDTQHLSAVERGARHAFEHMQQICADQQSTPAHQPAAHAAL